LSLDGDGVIDSEEFGAVMSSLGMNRTKAEAQGMIDEVTILDLPDYFSRQTGVPSRRSMRMVTASLISPNL
jgi:Ca2+-binding EF-hand superfamily protein